MATATVDLISNKKIVPKEFNKIATRYDLATSLSHGYSDDLCTSVSALRLTGNERALDLCCGTGKSTRALMHALPNGKVIGLDNSEGMLEGAKRKFESEIADGKAEFVLRDAMNPNLENHSFDVVFAAYGLRNMPDYQTFLNNTYNLLKPGGQLCIHDYSLANTSWAKAYWMFLGYGFIIPFCTLLTGSSSIFTYLIKSVLKFPSPNEIESLIINAGYTEVKIVPHKSWRKPILHTFTAIK